MQAPQASPQELATWDPGWRSASQEAQWLAQQARGQRTAYRSHSAPAGMNKRQEHATYMYEVMKYVVKFIQPVGQIKTDAESIYHWGFEWVKGFIKDPMPPAPAPCNPPSFCIPRPYNFRLQTRDKLKILQAAWLSIDYDPLRPSKLDELVHDLAFEYPEQKVSQIDNISYINRNAWKQIQRLGQHINNITSARRFLAYLRKTYGPKQRHRSVSPTTPAPRTVLPTKLPPATMPTGLGPVQHTPTSRTSSVARSSSTSPALAPATPSSIAVEMQNVPDQSGAECGINTLVNLIFNNLRLDIHQGEVLYFKNIQKSLHQKASEGGRDEEEQGGYISLKRLAEIAQAAIAQLQALNNNHNARPYTSLIAALNHFYTSVPMIVYLQANNLIQLSLQGKAFATFQDTLFTLEDNLDSNTEHEQTLRALITSTLGNSQPLTLVLLDKSRSGGHIVGLEVTRSQPENTYTFKVYDSLQASRQKPFDTEEGPLRLLANLFDQVLSKASPAA